MIERDPREHGVDRTAHRTDVERELAIGRRHTVLPQQSRVPVLGSAKASVVVFPRCDKCLDTSRRNATPSGL